MPDGIYIPSVDAKDLVLACDANPEKGYSLKLPTGDWNMKKFINTLDYSLELIKLREVYYKIYRNRRFTFFDNGKEFSPFVINVTFKYAIKRFNRKYRHFYVRSGYDANDADLQDNVVIRDGMLVAIKTGQPVENPLPPEMLESFEIKEMDDGTIHYVAKTNIPTISNVKDLREKIYEEGFTVDGRHYVRYKRSSGSSRVGKCLFIEESLYPKIHEWELCGLKVNEGDPIDLAALEAYIALTTSSIIGTMEIYPHQILLIDDYESTFKDRVIVTDIENSQLRSYEDTIEITNSIWDGQSLMDVSIMPTARRTMRDEYGVPHEEEYKPGMMLLRARFFKSCCFNTNIQQFFADHDITSVEQLNGKTRAQSLEDIKLITTPSSIKYLKFGTWDAWLDNLEPTFGCVKHEKKTHFFEGHLVRTHYQLLNTLQMSQKEMDEFLVPSLEYITGLRNDPSVVRHYIHYQPDDEEFVATCQRDVAFSILGLNDNFAKTKVYYNFMRAIIKKYIDDIRNGHVMIHGNYSVLFGNAYEMLLQSIGAFTGEPHLKVGCLHSTNFAYDQTLLCSRSPHVCMGNILLAQNVADEALDKYFNLTPEIVCINSMGDNILMRLNGADFDSDSLLLSDDPLLVSVAQRNYDKFLVPTSAVSAKKTQRYYTSAQKADLDIKTSQNKIGEIINCSQELNSRLWDNVNRRKQTIEENFELYCDISKLSVLSGLCIDAAKKEFDIDFSKELKKIKKKYFPKEKGEKNRKPNFMGKVAKQKGYYDRTKNDYVFFATSMDFLQHTMNTFKIGNMREDEGQPLAKMLIDQPYDIRKCNYHQIHSISQKIDNHNGFVAKLWSSEYAAVPPEFKYQMRIDSENNIIAYLRDLNLSADTLVGLSKHADSNIGRAKHAQILNFLYASQNPAVLDLFKRGNNNGVPVLIPDPNGEYEYYGMKFRKEYPAHSTIDSI